MGRLCRARARCLLWVYLACILCTSPALAQNNFIAQVAGEKLDAFKAYLASENGNITQVISLSESSLIGFHGDQGLKARVRRFDGVMLISDNPEVQWIDPAKTILLGVSEKRPGQRQKRQGS